MEWKCRIGNISVIIDEVESCVGEGVIVMVIIEFILFCVIDLYYDFKDVFNLDDF